jgi:tetratricopeptide (TPR) repeat protein
MQARYALERSAWSEAATLAVPANGAPYVEAVARFARAIGAARSGKTAQAEAEVATLATLRDSLKVHNDVYWATIVDAQRLAATAWIAHARGRNDEAVRLAQQGAELEETVEKHPVTPGPLLPARELEGDLLMALGRHASALRSYEKTLEREPRRARALFGAAQAAEKSGNRAAARARYEELSRLMDRADASRTEAAAARAYLARSR